MKQLFTIKNGANITHFDNKEAAKEYRNTHGGDLHLGADHIGPHGCNKVTQHMRNKRKK